MEIYFSIPKFKNDNFDKIKLLCISPVSLRSQIQHGNIAGNCKFVGFNGKKLENRFN